METELADTFLLTPLPAEIVALALEDWAIWKRWQAAYERNEVALETHPALPADRQRHNELAVILQKELQTDEKESFCARGQFKASETDQCVLLVEWELISKDDAPDQRGFVSLSVR